MSSPDETQIQEPAVDVTEPELVAPATGEDAATRYQVGILLGKGGFGTVRRVFDTRLQRNVAMKTLHREPDGPTVRRFLHEARVSSRLEHPDIVPVYDLGTDPDGMPYFTMREIRGTNLSVLVREERVGRLARRIQIFARVCEAVAYAHDQGVLHLDIKPGNVIVGDYGEVLLLDWGLAAEASGDPADPEGEIIGTPSYMSPEQTYADPSQVDARSDVYSLGALLYALLVNRAPFRNEPDVMAAVRQGRFVAPRRATSGRVPRELDAIVRKAMAGNPADRYASAAALRDDVRAFQEGRPVSAFRYGLVDRAWKWLARHRTVVRSVLITSVVALGLLGAATVVYVVEVLAARDRALLAERAAALRLADSELALATSLADQERAPEARERCEAARAIYEAQGVSARPAEILSSWLAWRFAMPTAEWRPAMTPAALSGDGRQLLAIDTEAARILDTVTGETLRSVLVHGPTTGGFVLGAPWLATLDGETWRVGPFGEKPVVSLPAQGTADYSSTGLEIRPTGVIVRGDGARAWSLDGAPAGPDVADAWVQRVSSDGRYGVGRSKAEEPSPVRVAPHLFAWDLLTGAVLGTWKWEPGADVAPGLVARVENSTLHLERLGGSSLWEAPVGYGDIPTFVRDAAEIVLVGPSGFRVLDTATGELLRRVSAPGAVTATAGTSAVSPDGSLVATLSDTLQVWPLGTPRRQVPLGSPPTSVAWSADGLLLAAGTWSGEVLFIEPATASVLRRVETTPRGTRDVAFTADGRLAVSADRDGNSRVIDTATGAILRTLRGGETLAMAVETTAEGHAAVVAYDSGGWTYWDLDTGAVRARGVPAGQSAWDVAVHGDRVVVSGRSASDPVAAAWSLAGGEATWRGAGVGSAYGVDLSPDGTRVLVGCHDSRLRTGEVGRELEEVAIGKELALTVDWSSQGLVAVGRFDGTVEFFDPVTWIRQGAFKMHESVADLAFSPDGRMLASVGGEGELIVFDLELGSRMAGTMAPGVGPVDRARLAEGAMIRGQWSRAVELLRAMEAPPPLELARSLWASGDYDGAREALGRVTDEASAGTVAAWRGAP